MYHKFSGSKCLDSEARFVPQKGITRYVCKCGRHEELVPSADMVKVDYKTLADNDRRASYDRRKG